MKLSHLISSNHRLHTLCPINLPALPPLGRTHIKENSTPTQLIYTPNTPKNLYTFYTFFDKAYNLKSHPSLRNTPPHRHKPHLKTLFWNRNNLNIVHKYQTNVNESHPL